MRLKALVELSESVDGKATGIGCGLWLRGSSKQFTGFGQILTD